MNLFSKLFGGDKDAEKAVKDLFSGLINEAKAREAAQEAKKPAAPAQPAPQTQPVQKGPAGRSWGELMPDEPNQYDYNGAYFVYFENIFRQEFPLLPFTKECPRSGHYVYTFTQAGRTALVVELLSKSSAAAALRERCRRSGIPYLRFYHNVEGWWNTRSYVTGRMRKALGML